MSLAIAGRMDIVIVVMAAALGSWCGDVLAYHVGRLLSRRTSTWATGSEKRRKALDWVEERQEDWGPALIMSGRFVPGGVTAVGLSAGVIQFPVRKFLAFAALAQSSGRPTASASPTSVGRCSRATCGQVRPRGS